MSSQSQSIQHTPPRLPTRRPRKSIFRLWLPTRRPCKSMFRLPTRHPRKSMFCPRKSYVLTRAAHLMHTQVYVPTLATHASLCSNSGCPRQSMFQLGLPTQVCSNSGCPRKSMFDSSCPHKSMFRLQLKQIFKYLRMNSTIFILQ